MANENSRDPTIPKPQNIPLAMIHDLPGVPISRQPDKSYGGLVTSIQTGGVKEPVILRLREDGEYQLVTGYRRKRACELMKRQDIPALVYEMSLQEAIKYHGLANGKPAVPVPGKLVEPGAKKEEKSDIKGPENPTPGEKPKEVKPPEGTKAPEPAQGEKKEVPPPKKPEPPAPPAPGEKPKEVKPPEGTKVPEPAQGEKKETPPPKKPEPPVPPAPGEKPKEVKPPEGTKVPEPAQGEKKETPPPKKPEPPAPPAPGEKPKEVKPPEGTKVPEPAQGEKKETPPPKKAEPPAAVIGPAARGPAGTAISQVFDERLIPPDEKAKRDIPSPQENEAFFILLHPAYLEKSKYNTISVDTRSEDYQELKKSIELNGVKDPVLARIGDEGTLVSVFDVSQTEGRELPSLVSELSGDVPDFENVYARLAALCPLPVELGPVPGTAKGYASFAENRVVVRSGMSQVQTIKTLIHETAHAKLHAPDFLSENPKPRQEKEVEAESVAYVVCQHFGIDTSDYSLGYVAGWSRGKELAELKASLNVIHATAGEIINAIQPPPPELTRDEPSQEYRRKVKKTKRK